MGEDLNFNNILTPDEVDNLFVSYGVLDSGETESQEQENAEQENKETTEVNTDELFEKPESVGSEDSQGDTEDTTSEGSQSSPNFYSSIAKALKEDGVFPNLDKIDIKDAEDFRMLIENQITQGLTERQKNLQDALTSGMEVSRVQLYQNTFYQLENITDEHIEDESENAENIRKQLIYQDFINRGYSQERASREVEKSINAGTDIEDAKEALEELKRYFKSSYEKEIQEAKDRTQKQLDALKEEAETLKKSILETKKAFGDIDIDKATRQRVYDNLMKTTYTDEKTGEKFTAILKYERENRIDFLKNVSLIYTLTDGFKNLDKIIKGKVRKEYNKNLRELEHTLTNSGRPFDGNLTFVGGVSDSESSIPHGWKLDV